MTSLVTGAPEEVVVCRQATPSGPSPTTSSGSSVKVAEGEEDADPLAVKLEQPGSAAVTSAITDAASLPS